MKRWRMFRAVLWSAIALVEFVAMSPVTAQTEESSTAEDYWAVPASDTSYDIRTLYGEPDTDLLAQVGRPTTNKIPLSKISDLYPKCRAEADGLEAFLVPFSRPSPRILPGAEWDLELRLPEDYPSDTTLLRFRITRGKGLFRGSVLSRKYLPDSTFWTSYSEITKKRFRSNSWFIGADSVVRIEFESVEGDSLHGFVELYPADRKAVPKRERDLADFFWTEYLKMNLALGWYPEMTERDEDAVLSALRGSLEYLTKHGDTLRALPGNVASRYMLGARQALQTYLKYCPENSPRRPEAVELEKGWGQWEEERLRKSGWWRRR